jgi:hypothetical protein
MSDEQRRTTRSPNFRYAKLVLPDAGEGEQVFPVILRDTSAEGVGAMYIGKDDLSATETYFLRDPEGDQRKVRIVWTKQVADFVQMMGMVFVDE